MKIKYYIDKEIEAFFDAIDPVLYEKEDGTAAFIMFIFIECFLSAIYFIPQIARVTNLQYPGISFIVGAAIPLYTYIVSKFKNRKAYHILQWFDTLSYILFAIFIMLTTDSPVNYIMAIFYSQTAMYHAHRIKFTIIQFIGIWVIPFILSFMAWPNIGLILLVFLGGILYIVSSRNLKIQRKLEKERQGLKVAFNAADSLATNSMDLAIATTAAELGGHLHEMRNAITAIISNLKYLEDSTENMDMDQRDAISETVEASWNTAHQISKIMDIVKARGKTVKEDFNPRDVIQTSIVEYLNSTRDEIEIKNNCSSNYILHGNPDHLGVSITNLVRNATQAGATIISIKSELQSRKNMVCFLLSDNGTGISAELQSKLFSAPVVSTKEEGSGLGIYITQKLIQLLGGTIAIKSSDSNGTVFEISLPISHVVVSNQTSILPDN